MAIEKKLNNIKIHSFKSMNSYEIHKEEINKDELVLVEVDVESLKGAKGDKGDSAKFIIIEYND